jgi:hypothetical protein
MAYSILRDLDSAPSNHVLRFEYHWPRYLILGLPHDVSTVVDLYSIRVQSRIRDVLVYQVGVIRLPGYGEDTITVLRNDLVDILDMCLRDCPTLKYRIET